MASSSHLLDDSGVQMVGGWVVYHESCVVGRSLLTVTPTLLSRSPIADSSSLPQERQVQEVDRHMTLSIPSNYRVERSVTRKSPTSFRPKTRSNRRYENFPYVRGTVMSFYCLSFSVHPKTHCTTGLSSVKETGRL